MLSRHIDALKLPSSSRADLRVTKAALIDRAARVAADKRRVREDLEELRWVAALRPSQVGIPAFDDGHQRFEEVLVLAMKWRKGFASLARIVHRGMSYPVLLFGEGPEGWGVSVARKRVAQDGTGSLVIDGLPLTVEVAADSIAPEVETAFLQALALDKQSFESLRTVYDGWMRGVEALQAALVSGRFVLPQSESESRRMRERLEEVRQLDKEIATRRRQAAREKQMARQVALNTEIKQLESALAAMLQSLGGGMNAADAQTTHR